MVFLGVEVAAWPPTDDELAAMIVRRLERRRRATQADLMKPFHGNGLGALTRDVLGRLVDSGTVVGWKAPGAQGRPRTIWTLP